jgi:hypothetical protein
LRRFAPPKFGGVIARNGCPADHRTEVVGDDVLGHPSEIAAAHGPGDAVNHDLEPALFPDLANTRVLRRFVLFAPTPRDRPESAPGIVCSLDEKHPAVVIDDDRSNARDLPEDSLGFHGDILTRSSPLEHRDAS